MAGTARKRLITASSKSDARAALVALAEIIDDMERLRGASASRLYMALGNPAFRIKTNFDVENANALSYTNAGTLKTFAATTTFDTGTSKTIATTKWGAAILTLDASGAATLTWAAGDFTSEALALAALVIPAATHTILGAVTVQAAGITWTAGTDALTTGTGGTPANATNYYNTINPNNLVFGSVDAAADLTAAKVVNLDGSAIVE